jgi:hypothetical protein
MCEGVGLREPDVVDMVSLISIGFRRSAVLSGDDADVSSSRGDRAPFMSAIGNIRGGDVTSRRGDL